MMTKFVLTMVPRSVPDLRNIANRNNFNYLFQSFMNQERARSLLWYSLKKSKREAMEYKSSALPLSQAGIEEGKTVFYQFLEDSEQIRATSDKIGFPPNVDINKSSVDHNGEVIKRENIAKAVQSSRTLLLADDGTDKGTGILPVNNTTQGKGAYDIHVYGTTGCDEVSIPVLTEAYKRVEQKGYPHVAVVSKAGRAISPRSSATARHYIDFQHHASKEFIH